jgi:hypothetical protein
MIVTSGVFHATCRRGFGLKYAKTSSDHTQIAMNNNK